MSKIKQYSPEVKERAVRLALEQRDQYPSDWAAAVSISSKFGCTPETLRSWITKSNPSPHQAQQKSGDQRIKELERENKELRRANEIMRKAAAFFAQAELDRGRK